MDLIEMVWFEFIWGVWVCILFIRCSDVMLN